MDAIERRMSVHGWRKGRGPNGLFLALLLTSAGFAPAGAQGTPPDSAAADTVPARVVRDPVGDLNAEAVRAGTFDGAILLPGTQVSLAVGGFVKTAAYSDSYLQNAGVSVLPGFFGSAPGGDGTFGIDATLSRIFFDGRAPVPGGSIRGYIEWDFNGANNGSLNVNPRLAFGTWDTGSGRLLAGWHWSTLMDLKVIPESLTSPTLSGLILTRQAQIRWTQPVGEGISLEVAVENPSNRDLFTVEDGLERTRAPDLVAGAEVNSEGRGHLRLAGIARRVEARTGDVEGSATGWGLHVGGHLEIGEGHRATASAAYGKGIARYLLGSGPRAGGVVDPSSGNVELLDNYGGLVTYRHRWSEKNRSTVAVGHARGEILDLDPPDTFENTTYAFANFMRSPIPFITMGVEYSYARLTTRDGSVTDNHRIAVGVQIY